MRKSRKIRYSLHTAILLVTTQVMGAELEKIDIEANKIVTPTMQRYESVTTGSEVTEKGIELQGAKAKTSVYEALSILPGVTVENPDSNGLAIEQGSTRIRGVRSSMGALTVEGVPNYGGNPIGPRDYLYDMENMNSISLYKGGIPANIGTGIGARGGAIELHPKWAQKEFGASISQSLGSNSFTRTHLRLDSGELGSLKTALSGSFSYANADKWRGKGDLGGRKNFNATLVQPIGNKASLKLWYNKNDQDQHLYMPLSYAQIDGGNLGKNYKLDYNENLSGVQARDINYYDYNKGTYKNDDYIGLFDYEINDIFALTLKPYYSSEDSEIFQGNSGNNMIQKRTRDITRYGLLAELGAQIGSIKTAVGYQYEDSKMDIYTQNYAPIGGNLVYRGYGVTGTAGHSYIHSPYATISGTHGKLNWQGGLKYFLFQDSEIDGYTSSGAPSFQLVRASDLDRKAKDYNTLLPNIGISYSINDSWQPYANYGKSVVRPYSYIPLMNTYNTYRTQFRAAGVTAQDLFDGYALEESDSFDIGVRYGGEYFDVTPALFYAKHKNLLTVVSDNRVIVNGKPVSYQQNIGKATSYGLEAEFNAYISDSLSLFINPTFTKFTYDEDISFQGSILDTKNRQIVDTPEITAKVGVIYSIYGFEFIPTLGYVGERYGDALGNEKIDAYWLSDLKVTYKKDNLFKGTTLKASLEINNIFDKQYVSVINASDDSRGGSASYYQGAPLNAIFSIALQY